MTELLPGLHAVLVGAITLLAFIAFARDRQPVETVCTLVLIALPLLFLLLPYRGEDGRLVAPFSLFGGFGHPALIAICSLMVIGSALTATGALQPTARSITTLMQRWPRLAFLLVLGGALLASGVVNDTPIVVLAIPLLLAVAARLKTSAAPWLMPVNFAVIVGGMATTIGTSTNLIVIASAEVLGVTSIPVFGFYDLVLTAAIPALLYLWLVAPWLLRHVPAPPEPAPQGSYLAELFVRAASTANGLTLSEAAARCKGRLKVLEVLRGRLIVSRMPDLKLVTGDSLVVEDTPDSLRELCALLGTELRGLDTSTPSAGAGHLIAAELVLGLVSPLVGTTLERARFAETWGVAVVGLRPAQRHAQAATSIDTRVLHAGDMLLLHGTTEQLEALRSAQIGMLLDSRQELPRTGKARIALGVMALVVATAATGLLPIALSAPAGVAALVLAGALGWDDAKRAISIKVILLVAAGLALGQALQVTGAIKAVAAAMLTLAHLLDPAMFLAALMLCMGALTNFVSNGAAAAIGTPIGIEVARQLGAPPEAFILAVLFGCNLCFLTPMGYQTNLLVMNAAGYRFRDFVRVGAPLFVLMWLSLSWLLARRYGLA